MHSTFTSLETETVPCALKDYLSKGGSRYNFADLTEKECRIAFQYWVAYARKDLSDIHGNQHAACPLLYCGQAFDNFESYLHHVSVCPRLSHGWYKCPICHRREKFTPPRSRSGAVLQQPAQKKETKLRRAIAFFKQFGGCKSFSRQNNLSRHRSKRTQDKSAELDADPRKSWLNELDTVDRSVRSMIPGNYLGSGDVKTRGLETSEKIHYAQFESQLEPKCSGDSKMPVELQGSDPPCYELISRELPLPELPAQVTEADFLMDLDEPVDCDLITPVSPTLTIRESTFTPLSDLVSPITPRRNNASPDLLSPVSPVEGDSLSDLFSPVSPIESPSTEWSMATQVRRPVLSIITDTEALKRKEPSTVLAKSNEGPRQPYRLFPSDAIRPPALKFLNECNKGLISKDGLPSSQTLVKDVRDFVHVLNKYWLDKLSSEPGLQAIKARLRADSPVDAGLQALQCFFRQQLPRTFAEVFSLTELAFACAYMLYEDDNDYSWDALFRDVLEWRHAIADEEDQHLFLKVAFLIWSPPEMRGALQQGVTSSRRPLLSSIPTSKESQLPSTTINSAPNTNTTYPIPQQPKPQSSPSLEFHGRVSGLGVLKNGKVIRVCSRYLDALEYIGIADRDGSCSPHSPLSSERSLAHIQMIENHIIVPLVKQPEMAGFCDAIMTTAIDLCDGVLRNIREVEVNLGLNASRCNQSGHSYEEFVGIVASLCDNAMSQPNSSWRDRYYAADLDKVQAICLELERPRCQKLSTIEQVQTFPTLAGPSYLRLETPTSANSHGKYSPTSSISTNSTSTFSNGPPSSVTSDASTQLSSLSSSPTELFLQSPSNNFSTPPLPPIPILRCSMCGQPFRGVYRTTNFKRHMRNTHVRRVKLICPEPGCGVECSRTDNLRKHRRVVHGLVDKKTRHNRRKTC